jgi:hypothetical protein
MKKNSSFIGFTIAYVTFAFFAIFSMQRTSLVFAQNQQVQDVGTQSTEGKIIKKDANTIYLETSDGSVKQFTVPESVSIKKNTHGSSISNLQVNDRVTIKNTDTGLVLSVDATSGQLFDASKVALPIALVVALVLVAVMMAKRKVSQPRIKTV